MESAPKLLISFEAIFLIFTKRALKSLDNQAGFDSAIRRFDPSRPSHAVLRLVTVCNLRLTGPKIRLIARSTQSLGSRSLSLTDAEPICRTTITGVSETGQEMLRVDLIEKGAGKGGRLQIFVPPMLFLEAGVRVSIGQGDSVNVPFAWCFSNTCVAARAVNAGFIRPVRAGQTMTLKVVDPGISTVVTSLPLDRFAAINQGPPSLIFGESAKGMPPK